MENNNIPTPPKKEKKVTCDLSTYLAQNNFGPMIEFVANKKIQGNETKTISDWNNLFKKLKIN